MVNLNPGGIAGGSGAQYFVGTFNGKTFTSDDKPYTPPSGTLIGDGGFEGADYGNWTPSGAAFGSGPAHADNPTNGAIGHGWVDSYGSADSDTGTLTSPTFTISHNYINFLMAGGNHPYLPGGLAARRPERRSRISRVIHCPAGPAPATSSESRRVRRSSPVRWEAAFWTPARPGAMPQRAPSRHPRSRSTIVTSTCSSGAGTTRWTARCRPPLPCS